MNKKPNQENKELKTTQVPADENPFLRLSMNDKVYLEVAYKKADPLYFIYALFLPRDRNNSYVLEPQSEIITFQDANQANIYYQTLQQIKNYQAKEMKFIADLSNTTWFPGLLARFKENIK